MWFKTHHYALDSCISFPPTPTSRGIFRKPFFLSWVSQASSQNRVLPSQGGLEEDVLAGPRQGGLFFCTQGLLSTATFGFNGIHPKGVIYCPQWAGRCVREQVAKPQHWEGHGRRESEHPPLCLSRWEKITAEGHVPWLSNARDITMKTVKHKLFSLSHGSVKQNEKTNIVTKTKTTGPPV